ncbi:MAG: YicC family protein [Magnetococcales bacterium]|nr:YicC family protein [Magnetococcales bacterium]
MLQSMTGFGSDVAVTHGFNLSWQLKSVNHRFLDLAFRLPEGYGELEILATKQLKTIFNRGRIECTLSLRDQPEGQRELQLDSQLLNSLLYLEGEINSQAVKDRVPLSVANIISWPGMLQKQSRPQIDDLDGGKSFSHAVLESLDRAAASLTQMRLGEGRGLEEVIRGLLAQLTTLVDKVVANLPRVRKSLEERLNKRLLELVDSDIDEGRLAQEQLYFINRLDVSEELDRLKIHLNEIVAVLDHDEPVGRRLDFLCQELNREANTLCSKAQDGEITQIGIDMKVIVEKFREQVQNLE